MCRGTAFPALSIHQNSVLFTWGGVGTFLLIQAALGTIMVASALVLQFISSCYGQHYLKSSPTMCSTFSHLMMHYRLSCLPLVNTIRLDLRKRICLMGIEAWRSNNGITRCCLAFQKNRFQDFIIVQQPAGVSSVIWLALSLQGPHIHNSYGWVNRLELYAPPT